jgi:polysaccharide biosynthesis protein PslH
MKILVLLSRFPYPLEKGDKLRAYHQIKLLAKKNQIIVCCLSHKKIKKEYVNHIIGLGCEVHIIKLNPILSILNLIKGIFSDEPFQVSYFYQKRAQKNIDKLIEKHLPEHIYCQLIRVTEYIKKYTIFNKTLDYMDALSEGMKRRYNNSSFFMKPIISIETKRLKKYESYIFSFFDNKTIITLQDKEKIDHRDRNSIVVIPNGVDIAYFKPYKTRKKYDLLFTGNMSYPPNVESANYIVKKILPLVWEKFPDCNLLIAGANPAISVKMLSSKNVVVSGWVDDIRTAYNESKIFIAPMQTGSGLQNKLIEAMAMKIPCITSELANNALCAKENIEILVGRTPQEYCNNIFRLLSDDKERENIAEKAHEFVEKNYNWTASVLKLERFFL